MEPVQSDGGDIVPPPILDQAIGEVEAGEVSDEVLGDYAGW